MTNETLGEIVKTHIELDVVNKQPTLVFTDFAGRQWVYEEQQYQIGFITKLVRKEDSWYFKIENKS